MPAKDAGDVPSSPGQTTTVGLESEPSPPTPAEGPATAGTDADKKTRKGKKANKKADKKPGKRDKPDKSDRAKKTPGRKRTRKPLGKRRKKSEPEAPPEMVKLTVRGLPEPVEVRKGGKLLEVAKEANLNLFWGPWAQAFNCRGKGYCNLCRVEVLDGAENLSPPTKRETKRLANRPDSWRLACTTKIEGPVEIDSFPVRDPDKVARPESIRRALLDPDQREEQRRNRREANKADRAEKRAAKASSDNKPGLLARLTKKKDDQEGAGTDAKADKKQKKAKKGKKAKADKADEPVKADAAAKKDEAPKSKGGSFRPKGRQKK